MKIGVLNPADFFYHNQDVQVLTEAVRIENERLRQCHELVTTMARLFDSDGNLLKEILPKDFCNYGIENEVGKS